jgi:alkylated DNA nucleotide flippase Atl1
MARAKKSWQEKLADAKAKPGLPKVFFCEKTRQKFVVPAPTEVEEIIRQIPRGRLVTMADIGQRLRAAHAVDVACPMTTGIFAWLIANAAEADAAEGKPATVPWWRVLKTGGLLNPRYPGGGQTQRRRLEEEGHRVAAKGKALMVVAYEQSLIGPA